MPQPPIYDYPPLKLLPTAGALQLTVTDGAIAIGATLSLADAQRLNARLVQWIRAERERAIRRVSPVENLRGLKDLP
jgi:hypothetical protein